MGSRRSRKWGSTPNSPAVMGLEVVDVKPISPHFFVERGAVDVERPGGLLAVPVEGPERLDDDPLLGTLQGFPEGADPRAGAGRRRAGVVGRPAAMADD